MDWYENRRSRTETNKAGNRIVGRRRANLKRFTSMKQNLQTLVLLAIGTLLIGFIGFRVFQSNRVSDDYGKKITIGDYDHCANCTNLEVEDRPPRDSILSYSQERIIRLAQENPCYLPLIQDPSYWSPEFDSTKYIRYPNLFNSSINGNEDLPDSLMFVRRYLVGDFMVLNADSSIRGNEELSLIHI